MPTVVPKKLFRQVRRNRTSVAEDLLRVSNSSPGDCSYDFSSVKSGNGSFDHGSAVSADSFIFVSPSYEDDISHEFNDPYLDDGIKRRRNLRKSPPREASRTPVTAPLDDSTVETPPPRSVKGLPEVLEIPIKSFETVKDGEFVNRRRDACPSVQLKSLHERNHWNKIVSDRIRVYGPIHVRVGEGLLLLGNAHMSCKEYNEALKVFTSTVRIFRKLYGDSHLSVAKALDKVGLAAGRSRSAGNLKLAMAALSEGFDIRYESLGPMHVDTVDSLNNMAGVHLHMRDYHLARKAYHEVYIVRQIIFGPRHPSVAITAHALGGVHLKLSQVVDAARYYRRAMEVYKKLKLKSDNPTMKRLLKDIVSLERISGALLGIKH